MSCSEIFGFVISEALCRSKQRAKFDPAMFSRISGALQAAADVVAPPCPRVEDLRYHWTQLTIVCQRCRELEGQAPAVEETHVPRHLTQMLKLLVAEEQEQKLGGPLSPCMEYLIQEKVLATLASYARADRPLGIRQHAYVFLVGVLNHLHHSHLHHAPIHKPLQTMVRAVCEMRASPYEAEEMEFLSTLCEKIRQDCTIILLYIQPLALTGRVHTGYTPEDSFPQTPTHTSSSEMSSSGQQPSDKLQAKFPLVDALLNLCHSADSKIANSAHECLIGIASVRESQSSSTISKHTLLPHYLATRLVTSAEEIPVDSEPALIEDIPMSDKASLQSTPLLQSPPQQQRPPGFTTMPLRIEISTGQRQYLPATALSTEASENSDSDEEEELGEFPGRAEVVTFLHWLTYCDKVVSASDGVLGSTICSTVREVFLEGILRHSLTSNNEDMVSLYIALTTKIVLAVSSPLLVNNIISWLTEDHEAELVGNDGCMRQHIMAYCYKPPHHLQIQALRLLQIMIEKPGSLAAQSLALNYVMSRGYHDSSAAEYQQSSWSDEEDERYKHREEDSSGSPPVSRTLAPANINKIVKRFLMVVPEELRSTKKDDFESYMADAQRQYRDTCRSCASFGWPREAVTPECPSDTSSTASRESRPESDGNTYYEGPLLSMLMNFLEHLDEQDYDINLQVTSLVATLALLPHPHLHEYLLNPTLPLTGGVRTPYTVLSSVVSKIQKPIMEREDYLDHLKVTRYHLLGTMEELEFERDSDDRKFEALIVIEEFTKELASIAYAKYSIEGSS